MTRRNITPLLGESVEILNLTAALPESSLDVHGDIVFNGDVGMNGDLFMNSKAVIKVKKIDPVEDETALLINGDFFFDRKDCRVSGATGPQGLQGIAGAT